MARIIEEGLLDDLEFNEIMGILSLFVADKDREEIFLDEVNLSQKEKSIIKSIINFTDVLADEELKLVRHTPFHFGSEWNLAFK
jgi:hypothetical protein